MSDLRARAKMLAGTDMRIRSSDNGLEHDPEKWVPVFRKRSCSNKKIERDDESKGSHHALEAFAADVSD
jgi:hypothetical protein